MKKLIVLLSAIFAIQSLTGQIVITQEDMPNTGDTIRQSSTVIVTGFDPSLTGPGYTWDFQLLNPQTQSVEDYVSTQSTPFLYQIIFNQSVASIASPVKNLNFLPGFEITDAYAFYKENSNNYVRAGYAATLMGVPVPMKFNQPELLYNFPLQAGSPADSSYSTYSLDFPNIGYFSIERNRVNSVDGWGTLITPYGSFNTLRVKSIITERDSLYIDSVQFGAPINRFYTEYKWLSNDFGIPLLTITQEGPVISASYIDSVRNLNPMIVDIGSESNICQGDSKAITALVSNGVPPYAYLWSTLDTTATIRVAPADTATYMVVVTDQVGNMATGEVTINVIEFQHVDMGADSLQVCAGSSLPLDAGEGFEQVTWFVNGTEQSQSQFFTVDSTGIGLNPALILVEYQSNGCSGSDTIVVSFVICGGIDELKPVALNINPNPVQDFMIIEAQEFTGNTDVWITSPSGQTSRPLVTNEGSGRLKVMTNNLNPGHYIVVITSANKKGSAKFIKQ